MSEAIKDGVYFGMPEHEYLSIERLSKSGIKELRISPADYWAGSPLNPNPEPLTPEQEKRREFARFIGRAYHCARLDPESFRDRYVREPSQADYSSRAGFLSTGKAMEAVLKDQELKVSGSVLEQANRLADNGYDRTLLWHLILADWEAERGTRLGIPAESFDQIVVDMERIAMVPSVHELLTGGAPEVSIFWTCPESGIAMKCRLDYLKADTWAEFKSFANASGKHLYTCLIDAVRFNGYHIDATVQLQALEMVRAGLPVIVGNEEQREMVEAIQLREFPLKCHLIFQQKGGVPNVLDRRFAFWQPHALDALEELKRDGAPEEKIERSRKAVEMAGPLTPSAIHAKAIMEIKAAKRDYLAYSEIYERGQPWLPFNPSGTIEDADFHPAWLEEIH